MSSLDGKSALRFESSSFNPPTRRRVAAPAYLISALVAAFHCALAGPAVAGVIFNFSDLALGGGSRWDAAPRVVNLGGTNWERSLDGGLRYSVQGGSYQAFRDLFSWQGSAPSVPAFQTAVQQAFDAWASVDPVTGLTSPLFFLPDLATPVVGFNMGSGGLDRRGAEIDLFGSNDASFWDVGNTGTQAETKFGDISSTVTLTSGTANYAGSRAISGADIIINSNPGALYTLDLFRRLLTHEIGHTIGLGDVEGDLTSSAGAFIDDNYNDANSSAALATLTNSWALLVDPLNPANSPLQRYTANPSDPGLTTPGVDILMESRGLGISAGDPLTNLTPLTNDDYGTRQFLYPSTIIVPEPSTLASAAVGLVLLAGSMPRRRRTLGAGRALAIARSERGRTELTPAAGA